MGGIVTTGVVHPGGILLEEFLVPAGVSRYRLAKETFMDITRISEIIKGERGISADTALRFSQFFGNNPEYWMNLQSRYDLELRRREIAGVIQLIRRYEAGGNGNSRQASIEARQRTQENAA